MKAGPGSGENITCSRGSPAHMASGDVDLGVIMRFLDSFFANVSGLLSQPFDLTSNGRARIGAWEQGSLGST